jgi:hypothetical protein
MSSDTATSAAEPVTRGRTPAEVGRYLRISADRVRAMIARGEIGAIDTAPRRTGRRRYVVLPEHVQAWIQRHQAAPETPRPARRKRICAVDFYPD